MGGEFSAVHVRHVDVREEEVDGAGVLPAELQGMVGVVPLQYPVPGYCEDEEALFPRVEGATVALHVDQVLENPLLILLAEGREPDANRKHRFI